MRSLLFAFLLFACASSPESKAPPPPPPQEPNDCVKTCERQNMMRAVSPEMIRQDCERECASKN